MSKLLESLLEQLWDVESIGVLGSEPQHHVVAIATNGTRLGFVFRDVPKELAMMVVDDHNKALEERRALSFHRTFIGGR